VSGVGGTLGFVLFHRGTTSALAIWQEWFASDALGIITIAPLIIGLASATREPPARGETVEGLVALGSLIIMSVVVIALPPEPWTTVVPVALLFPVLLWVSARCQPVFAAAAAFIVTLAIVWATTIGIGQFGDASLPIAERVFAARAGILAVALCAYVLAALFAERRQHEVVLAESEARLQEALTAGAVTTFVWDLDRGSSQCSSNAAQVLGFDPRQTFTSNNFLSRVHAGDRERFKTLVRGVSSKRPAYSTSFRYMRDEREVWLEETAKAEFDTAGRLVRVKGLTLDVTARKRSEDQQRLLIAALDQRVKDLLGRIAAVAKDMQGTSSSLEEYVGALDLRISSIANTHTLLSQNHWEGVELAELIRRQLAPSGTDANTTIGGPKVVLSAPVAQVLAMVLHELVTNAVKHGALSTPHGRVEVNWELGPRGDAATASIAWREVGALPLQLHQIANTASASFVTSSRKSSAVLSSSHFHRAAFAVKSRFPSGPHATRPKLEFRKGNQLGAASSALEMLQAHIYDSPWPTIPRGRASTSHKRSFFRRHLLL
jgi:PAS domain S-box-containing protein